MFYNLLATIARISVAALSFLLGVVVFSVDSSLFQLGSVPRDVSEAVPAPVPLVSDEEKSKIILAALRMIDPKEDHVVTRPQNIVFVSRLGVPARAFEILSEEMFPFELRYIDRDWNKRAEVSYLEFTQWNKTRKGITVRETSYFKGGNIGGCTSTYRNDYARERTYLDCSAIAAH